MRKSVKIYVEGGGDSKKLKRDCRRAFSKFFNHAGFKEKMLHVVSCGSRGNAYDDFCTAVNNKEIPFLLVDSEKEVLCIGQPWKHLKQSDNWNKPKNTTDDRAHLMVQAMEAWFMADKKTLERYFGKGFNKNALPKNINIENIPKKELEKCLNKALKKTKKEKYRKGKHSFEILEKLDPQKVMNASGWAKRLIEKLNEAVSA